jgi:diaminopropionate ammonia-lyase
MATFETLPDYWFELAPNRGVQQTAAYGAAQRRLFDEADFATARRIISHWPGYGETPLHSLDRLASMAGVSDVHYKDESERFGLRSFKPLGGAYAVTRLLAREIARRGGSPVDTDAICRGAYQDITRQITVTAATDGNHGRSVAWGARMTGCRSVVFIHETVSEGRAQAIAALGAEVRRISGTYDDAVRAAQRAAEQDDWYLVQDTTDGQAVETTLDVMHGYTLLAAEACDQLPYDAPPTHVFLQAGVGGMAAAVIAYLWSRYGSDRPISLLVEPDLAACCYRTIAAGRPTLAEGALDSIMAGLACGEISTLAWEILEPGAFAAMQIKDEAAADCMRALADSRFADHPIVAGESAVAGLAGFIASAGNPEARRMLRIDGHSRILLFGTEGATDPEAYERLVGRSADTIRVH